MTNLRAPGTPGFHAIILAAGASRRMGRDKSRLPWISGQPLLRWMMEELTAAGWRPVVVLGPSNFESWARALPDDLLALNERPEAGKTTSVATVARRVPADARAILVTAVDQPRPRAIYAALREAATTHPESIVVPDHDGHRGHPVVLPGSLRHRLLALDEQSNGLRGLLDAHSAETIRIEGFDAAWLNLNLNTPATYEQALAHFCERG